MEEKKIIDLTGNQPERIAPKSKNTQSEESNQQAGSHHQNHPWKKHSRGNQGKRMNSAQNSEKAQENPTGNGPSESLKQEESRQKTPFNRNRHRHNNRDRYKKNNEEKPSELPVNEEIPTSSEEPLSPESEALQNQRDETSEAANESPEEPTEQFEVVGVRFRGAGKVYYFSPNGIQFSDGDHVILETVRGIEYGDITMGNRMVGSKEVFQPLKPVIRKADNADAEHFRHNCELEENAKPIFLEKVAKNKLEMQLVNVEYAFDNSKLCFYFTAEERVDFRELVKDLAGVFRTRIELRQIGVRDEARLYGGIGVCGRPFCCKTFLPDFTQVSIKMAKDQNLSLASSKISGTCGRLMCCLRFEQETYEIESKEMPQPNTEVNTPKGKAVVLESSFLSRTVKVKIIEDNTIKTFSLDDLKNPSEQKQEKKAESDASAEVSNEPFEKKEHRRNRPRHNNQNRNRTPNTGSGQTPDKAE